MKKEYNIHNIKVTNLNIVATIIVLIAIFGASYAFFDVNQSILNRKMTFGEGVNIAYILRSDTNTNYDFNVYELINGGKPYIDSTTSSGTVILENGNDYENLTCNFEIWYEPTIAYHNSANATGRIEMTIIGTDSSEQNSEFEFNIDNISAPQKIFDGVAIVQGYDDSVTQNWSFKFRHYNLNVDQSLDSNKSFGGKIYFKAGSCNESNE